MAEKEPTHEVNDRGTSNRVPIRNPMTGWKYKQVKIGPWKLPHYASPPVQLGLIAIVCFLCPGMFNALSGMGGGGQVDPHAADKANTALYSTFAVVGKCLSLSSRRLCVPSAWPPPHRLRLRQYQQHNHGRETSPQVKTTVSRIDLEPLAIPKDRDKSTEAKTSLA